MMNFTVEEMNLIHIYKGATREETVQTLRFYRPYFEDSDTVPVADSCIRKLEAMTDTRFMGISFEAAVYFHDEV